MPTVNTATNLRLGSLAVDKVFKGTTQVWPAEGEFDPYQLSGLAGWYLSTWTEWIEGQTINFDWTDYSDNAKDLVMVGTPGPTFQVKTPGVPVVRFKANEGRYRVSGTGITTEWTVAYVARLIGPTPGRIVTAYYRLATSSSGSGTATRT